MTRLHSIAVAMGVAAIAGVIAPLAAQGPSRFGFGRPATPPRSPRSTST